MSVYAMAYRGHVFPRYCSGAHRGSVLGRLCIYHDVQGVHARPLQQLTVREYILYTPEIYVVTNENQGNL